MDLLLTDIPGEWVEGHATNLDEAAIRRLGWLDRADAFLILADAIRLAGPERANLDAQTGRILRRVTEIASKNSRRPPVALVFTKFDGLVRELVPPVGVEAREPQRWGTLAQARRTWAALAQAHESGLEVQPFAVSAFPWTLEQGHPVGVMAPFTWALAWADRRDPWPPPSVSIPEHASSFRAMRRRHP